jgi:hypothetical protein
MFLYDLPTNFKSALESNNMWNKPRLTALVTGLVVGLVSTTTLAADEEMVIDLGKKSQLVCAAITVVGCVNNANCQTGSAKSFDLPEFMFVDFEKKVVRPTDESGHTAVSPIKNIEKTAQQIVFQGVENHRGWSAALNRSTGELKLSSVGADVSFMIFGACTAL